MSPTSIPSIGEVLRGILDSRETLLDPDLVELQGVRDTDIVKAKLQTAREDLARLIVSGTGKRTQVAAQTEITALERELIYAVRRDEIATDRPDDCWCLGAGGRRPFGLPMPTGETYTLTSVSGEGTHDGETRSVVDTVVVYGEHCDVCPEGKARSKRDARYKRMSRQWREKLRVRRIFGESHIPPEYQRFSWRSLPKPRAVAQASAWLDNRGDHPWLLLFGEAGRGKTTILYGIAAEVADQGEAVLCKTLPDLLQEIRATYSPNGGGDSPVIEILKSIRWLFLDDAGAEVPSGWVGDRLYQILNHRHNEQLPTVLTSNLDPEMLSEHLGERIYGRVKRMALPVFVGGNDLRDLPHGNTAEDDPEA